MNFFQNLEKKMEILFWMFQIWSRQTKFPENYTLNTKLPIFMYPNTAPMDLHAIQTALRPSTSMRT